MQDIKKMRKRKRNFFEQGFTDALAKTELECPTLQVKHLIELQN